MIILKNKENKPRIFIVDNVTSETKARRVVTDYLGYEPVFFDKRGFGKHELPHKAHEPTQYAEGWWIRIM